MRPPPTLEHLRAEPGGSEWLARLPTIADECVEQWSLRAEQPFEAWHSLVVPVSTPDGVPAILKINFPHREAEHEPDALAHWRGDGAIRLLAHDRERAALLIERCEPGTQLWSIGDEDDANRIAASVLLRLWRRPAASSPFRLLADDVEWWLDYLPRNYEANGRPFERSLLDLAIALARELVATQGDPVVAHQDFQGSNVLRATREPWLAIDPKPVVAEREFDVASLLRDRREELMRDPAPGRRLSRRLDLLAAELDLDRERMRGWAIVHALAWGVGETDVKDAHIVCARWFAEL